MKKLTIQLSILFAVLLSLAACKKELSREGSGLGAVARGTLTDSSGKCRDMDIRGSYMVDSTLTDSNYLLVKVNFSVQGKYKIYSDTVNGMWFADSGYSLQTGPAVVKIKGYGKPILPQLSDFILAFGSSYCSFSIFSITGGNNTDYFPNTFGSSWTYFYVPTVQVDNNEFTTTVLPKYYYYNSNVFFEFQQADLKGSKASYYFAKDNAGTHYALSTIEYDYVTVFDSIVPFTYTTYPFLKEKALLNDTWQFEQPGTSWWKGAAGKSKAVFAVIQKATPYKVGSKTYPDVIGIRREIFFQPNNATTYTKIMEGNAYYAKGVGLIDQVFPAIGVPQTITLKSAKIK